jgi:hypothetical protein
METDDNIEFNLTIDELPNEVNHTTIKN